MRTPDPTSLHITPEKDGKLRVTVLTFPEGRRVKAVSATISPSFILNQLRDLGVLPEDG